MYEAGDSTEIATITARLEADINDLLRAQRATEGTSITLDWMLLTNTDGLDSRTTQHFEIDSPGMSEVTRAGLLSLAQQRRSPADHPGQAC